MEQEITITIIEAEVAVKSLLRIQAGIGKLDNKELDVLISLIKKLNF